jgi:outer membrane protein OmpA-like peptidoglycan-associated protein
VVLLAMVLSGPAAARQRPDVPLQVQVAKSKVDMKEHRLEVRMSRTASEVKIKVFGESGAVLADEVHDFSGRRPGTPLIVTWSPSSDEAVGRIEVRAYDASGAWSAVELAPWFVSIPHDDVNFATGSDVVEPGEMSKIETAVAKVNEVLAEDRKKGGAEHRNITLYIAGHTDTVGNAAYNLKLSQARARSIGATLRQHGVRIPIAYEGFGETSLKVGTADNVDEPKNRRADYILGDDPPPMKTTGFRPVWKRIP